MVAELAAVDIFAAAFAADVFDRPGLQKAPHAAAEQFGGIDVLEFSPSIASAPLTPVDIQAATPDNVQPQIEFYLYGGMAAAEAVLPTMLEAGAGTLVFTTGGGSLQPVPYFGNVTAEMAALRNWALNLGSVVSSNGIHVAHVAIGVWIGDTAPEGMPGMPASEIAARYWELHTTRSTHELVVQK